MFAALWCETRAALMLDSCHSITKFPSLFLLLATFQYIHHFLHWRQLVEQRTKHWPDLWDEAYVRKLPVIISRQSAGETVAGCPSRTAPHRTAPPCTVSSEYSLCGFSDISQSSAQCWAPAEDVVFGALIWSNGGNMRWIESTPHSPHSPTPLRPSMRGSCGHLPLCAAG